MTCLNEMRVRKGTKTFDAKYRLTRECIELTTTSGYRVQKVVKQENSTRGTRGARETQSSTNAGTFVLRTQEKNDTCVRAGFTSITLTREFCEARMDVRAYAIINLLSLRLRYPQSHLFFLLASCVLL